MLFYGGSRAVRLYLSREQHFLCFNLYCARERISLPSLPRALQSGKSFSSSARTWILFNRRERKDFRKERKAYHKEHRGLKLFELTLISFNARLKPWAIHSHK